MRITITGATGFLGRHLVQLLSNERHELRTLTRKRHAGAGSFYWDPVAGAPPPASLTNAQVVIHLAGEPLAQRWTAEAKDKIRRSRVEGTRHLVEGLASLSIRPDVLLCASAIGYYGSRGEEVLTESSRPGEGFLAELCAEWEEAADLALALGVRVVKLRTGMVLGSDGGALAKMRTPFRAGVGGPLAGGRQWMSWIHMEDVVRMIAWAASNGQVRGPLNVTSPHPVRNSEFTRALARAVHRPALLPVPTLALQALYGEMASILLCSQHVEPQVALEAGFRFAHAELVEALRDLV